MPLGPRDVRSTCTDKRQCVSRVLVAPTAGGRHRHGMQAVGRAGAPTGRFVCRQQRRQLSACSGSANATTAAGEQGQKGPGSSAALACDGRVRTQPLVLQPPASQAAHPRHRLGCLDVGLDRLNALHPRLLLLLLQQAAGAGRGTGGARNGGKAAAAAGGLVGGGRLLVGCRRCDQPCRVQFRAWPAAPGPKPAEPAIMFVAAHSYDDEGPAELIEGQGHGAAAADRAPSEPSDSVP